MLSLILFFSIGSFMTGTSQVSAQDQSDKKPTISYSAVKPIDDISQAVPADPMDNTLNPNSPKYNSKDAYGADGTRFGPPGKRGLDISEQISNSNTIISNSVLTTDHQCWGTAMNTSAGTYTADYAFQSIYPTLTISSGQTLYAPTMACPGNCPLELVTYYACDYWGVMYRKVCVYNFTTGSFGWSSNMDTTFCNKYVRNNFYNAELLGNGSYWYALLYNYSTSNWEIIYSYANGSVVNNWDMWEEYNMAPNFPTLPEIYSQSIEARINGMWTVISAAYGSQLMTYPFTAPYSKAFASNYWSWHIGP
jgi:uncharacterized protein Usg